METENMPADDYTPPTKRQSRSVKCGMMGNRTVDSSALSNKKNVCHHVVWVCFSNLVLCNLCTRTGMECKWKLTVEFYLWQQSASASCHTDKACLGISPGIVLVNMCAVRELVKALKSRAGKKARHLPSCCLWLRSQRHMNLPFSCGGELQESGWVLASRRLLPHTCQRSNSVFDGSFLERTDWG